MCLGLPSRGKKHGQGKFSEDRVICLFHMPYAMHRKVKGLHLAESDVAQPRIHRFAQTSCSLESKISG